MRKPAVAGLAALVIGLALSATGLVSAQATPPVRYYISPASGVAQTGQTVDMILGVRTNVAIAGGSVHLELNNASFRTYSTSQNPAIMWDDYNKTYNDILFICKNNTCPPGDYELSTISINVGSSGTATAIFTPKETASPELSMLQASGASGSFSVSSALGQGQSVGRDDSGSNKPAGNTYTTPRSDGNGTTAEPDQQRQQTEDSVRRLLNNQSPAITLTPDEPEDKSFWSGKNILIVAIIIGALLASVIAVLWKTLFVGGGGGISSPPGPTISSGGSGSIYTR